MYSEIRQIRKQKGCNSGQFVCAVGETKIIFMNSILFIPCLGSCTEGDFRRNKCCKCYFNSRSAEEQSRCCQFINIRYGNRERLKLG